MAIMDAAVEKKFNAAMKKMNDGDFKLAYTAFKKLTADAPGEPELWYFRAECGNYAAGMFGVKVKPEDIVDSYTKAIELDSENMNYYQSYGLFCISIGKYDEAEKAYNEAAQLDSSMASSLYSEFAIEYYNAILSKYGEIMEDPKARKPYAKKALDYMFKALDISAEEAKEIMEE